MNHGHRHYPSRYSHVGPTSQVMNENVLVVPPEQRGRSSGGFGGLSSKNNSMSAGQGQSMADGGKKGPGRRSFLPRFSIKTKIIAVSVFSTMLAILVFCIAVFPFRGQAVYPVVELGYGKYSGTSLENGLTQWLGMRYAAAPTGENRFSAPKVPDPFDGVVAASTYGPGCQGIGSPDPGFTEDCLFVDVFAPTGANTDSKLPVYFFLQGGGLEAAEGHYNGSGLILAANMNMITVTITYRVGVFGFLASSEIQKGGSLNLGFRDQRQALQWVQENIAQFGGDPDHVVLGGQSAGAGSVMHHLVANNGTNYKLFQAALMQSQSVPPVRTVEASQYQYDNITERTGCNNATDTLACLRSLDAETLLAGVKRDPYPNGAGGSPVFPFNPVIDNDFVTALPVQSFSSGNFIKVPTIFGDDNDEGTVFTPHHIGTTSQSRIFIKNNFPNITSSQLDKYSDMYGFENDTDASDYWKKASTAYGETRYNCPGIHLSQLVTQNGNDKVWNWRYDVVDPGQTASGDDVAHGSEMGAIWGPPYFEDAVKSLSTTNQNVVPIIQGYWTSFVQTLDPNEKRANRAPVWEQWTGRNRLKLVADGTAMENVSDPQWGRCGYMAQISIDLRQ